MTNTIIISGENKNKRGGKKILQNFIYGGLDKAGGLGNS